MKRKHEITNSSVLFDDGTFTAWINLDRFVTTDKVFDRAAVASYAVVNATPAFPGFAFNGTSSTITPGNLGTIKTCMFWIKPNNLTQEIFQLRATVYVEIVAGTIVGNGRNFNLVFFVDGILGADTIIQDKWNFVAFTTSGGEAFSAPILGEVDGTGFYDGEISKFITSTAVLSNDRILSFYNYYKRFYSLGTS